MKKTRWLFSLFLVIVAMACVAAWVYDSYPQFEQFLVLPFYAEQIPYLPPLPAAAICFVVAIIIFPGWYSPSEKD
ncbi:MAG: hypothetical protein HN348_28175 [Proteobacteria bacterium]|nr:hypothetical protein [Pseudomonadota bacterium]